MMDAFIEDETERIPIESIVETMEIMGDPDTMAALRRGIQDVQEGNLVSFEEAKTQLDT